MADPNRKGVVDEVKKFLSKKSLLKDPKTVRTYTERLGYFLDWCERSGIKYLDQLTVGDDLLPYVSFLRQRKTTRDTLFECRYVYNIFQTCNTFLRANGILFARVPFALVLFTLNAYFTGQGELKRCTPAEVWADPQAAAMRFDNGPADWQSHAGALRFGGEEGIEDLCCLVWL